MSDISPAWAWAGYVAFLAFIAIGGGFSALVPELHRFAVETHQWATSEQFAANFALAQAAPGPNVIFVPLLGWHFAGWLGAVLSTLAVLAPSLALTLPLVRHGYKPEAESRLGRAVNAGVQPVAIGLLLSSAWVLFRSTDPGWRSAVFVIGIAVVLGRVRFNPAWMVGVGAALGIAGLI